MEIMDKTIREYGKGNTCAPDATGGWNAAERLVFQQYNSGLHGIYGGADRRHAGLSAACGVVGQRNGVHEVRDNQAIHAHFGVP